MVKGVKYEATLLSLMGMNGQKYSEEYQTEKRIGECGTIEIAFYYHHIYFTKYLKRDNGQLELEWRTVLFPVCKIIEELPSLIIKTKDDIYVFLVHSKTPECDTKDYFRRFCADESYDENKDKLDIDEQQYFAPKTKRNDFTYETLYRGMRNKVFGQDEYVQALCMAAMDYQNAIKVKRKDANSTCPPNTMLVAGESGSGKTYAVSVLAEMTDMELVVVDMTRITGTGWSGGNLDEVLEGKLRAVDKNKGTIIFFDEVDKRICTERELRENRTFDVMPSFLKLIETGELIAEDGKGGRGIYSLENAIFIFAGAFSGIEKYIEKRLDEREGNRRIGFLSQSEEGQSDVDASAKGKQVYERLYSNIDYDDFAEYNVDRQFLGRMARLCVLNRLTEKDYMNIILKSKDSAFLQRQKMLLISRDVHLEITPEACGIVVKQSDSLGLGARGVNSIITKTIDEGSRMVYCNERIERVVIDEKDGELIIKSIMRNANHRRMEQHA